MKKVLHLILCTVVFAMLASCNKAKLESTKEVIDNQNRDVVDPNGSDNMLGSSTEGFIGGTPSFQGPPSADLEIILSGRLTNEAEVNQQLILRPSVSTADPDDVANGACPTNPGIVEVRYRLPNGSWVSKARTNCESFDHQFSHGTPGRYPILMRVISNENEEAFAQENILITEPGYTFPENDGFGTTANPIITQNGTNIVFNSTGCETDQVEWNYGDGNKGNGISTNYTFQQPGQYYVRAFCSYQREGQTFARESSITIVVGGSDLTQDFPNIPPLPDPFDTPMQQGCDVFVPTPECTCPGGILQCLRTRCTNFRSICR